jgi:hypothetical protein
MYAKNSIRICLLPISSIFDRFWCICTADAISQLDTRSYYEINGNILNKTWNSSEKCIFVEGLCRMGSTLLTTPSLIWTSLFPENKTALLMQHVKSITDVVFPNLSLNSAARPTRHFWIGTMLNLDIHDHATQYYTPLNFTVSMINSSVGRICIYSNEEWFSLESAYNKHDSGINIFSLPLISTGRCLVLWLKNN